MRRDGKNRGLIQGKQGLTNNSATKREHENRREDNLRSNSRK